MATNDDNLKQRIQRLSDISAEPLEYLAPIAGYEEMPVVPLEDAIKPLVDFLPAVESYAYIATQRCLNPADGLSPDESAAIMLYTMSWLPLEQCLYYVLNANLRSKNREGLKPWFLYLRLFVGGLSRLPTEQRIVYRGVKKDLSSDYQAKKNVIWWGFSSATTHVNVLESDLFLGKTGARTMFNITCKSAPSIRNHSYFAAEGEVLLLAGTYFKIISCLPQDQLHIIQLEEIEGRFQFLKPISPSSQSTASVLTETKLLTPAMALKPPRNRNTALEELLAESKDEVKLLFSRENLDDNDMEIIAYYVVQINKACTQLDLSKNRFGFDGVRYLAAPLRYNNTLKELNLDDNRIGQQGALLIAQALMENTTLVKLQLSGNQIGINGILHLAGALQENKTLKELSLSRNFIEDQGIEFLFEVLQKNRTLSKLTLDGNQIGERGTQLLNKLNETNTSLNVTW